MVIDIETERPQQGIQMRPVISCFRLSTTVDLIDLITYDNNSDL